MKKWFGKKKLNEQLRIFFSIMITGLMMLMLGIFTFSTIRSSYVESEKQAGSQLDFMDSSYRTWLKSVNDLIVSVEMENAVQKFCRFQATDGIIYQELYSDLAGKLDSYLYVNGDVNFIVVVSGATGKYVFSGNQSMAATKFEQIYEENYAASQKAKVNGTLSIKYGNEYYIKEKHTVTFYQPIYSVTELDEQIGVICMNLNDSMLMDMNDSGNIELCMTDMEGNVLSSTDNELLNISGGLLDFHGQAEGMMNKVYYAVICGKPVDNVGNFVDYLRKEGKINLSAVVDKSAEGAKRAELRYRVLAHHEKENLSLVEVNLLTGRHHQIRVQFASRGLPLWGDNRYHPDFARGSRRGNIALCGAKLSFVHPLQKRKMDFSIMPSEGRFAEFHDEFMYNIKI